MNLNEYPKAIEEVSLEIATIGQRIADYRRALASLDDAFTFEVVYAVNPETNKPIFTNEQQRSSAIREKQRDHEGYQGILKNIEAADQARAVAVAKQERLRGEFSVGKLELREKISRADLLTD